MPPSALGAPARPEVGGSGSVRPQLLLIHGGSFLYEDPTFEPLTRPGAGARASSRTTSPIRSTTCRPRSKRRAPKRAACAPSSASPVYAYGSSAGGTLAALLAGDGLVSAAVAKAPISDLLTWAWPLETYGADYYERIMLSEPSAATALPAAPFRHRPVLVVQGRSDHVVPPAMNEAFAAKFTQVRLWVVPGGHHTERSRPRILASRAMRWLDRLTRLTH